jgi:mannosyltransferase OCH1-like enzyme
MRNSLYLMAMVFMSLSSFGFSHVNFDHSNGFDRMREYSVKYQEKDAAEKVELLRKNYERLKPSNVKSSTKPIIPKVIHQIWIGDNAIPANYKYYLETWRKYHPDWEIKLWTKKEILQENFASKDLFDRARGFAEQSDIARYEILYRYGGLYIDTDVQCFANFDELHHKYDFYINMEPPGVNKKIVSIVNMMIGAVPGHPIFAQALANTRENWDKTEEYFEKTFSNSWSSFARSNHNLAVLQTMHPLINAVFDFIKSENPKYNKSIVLPAGYNVPIYLVNRYPILNFLSRMIRGKPKVTNKIIIQPETMSFHFYDKNNSLLPEMSFAQSLFNNSRLKSYIYRIFNLRNKYYLAFEGLFDRNSPTVISYRTIPSIPKIIYLENKANLSAEELLDLRKKWEALNPDFTVEILAKTSLISRFYLLKDKGGVYVNSSFLPLKLEEFQYKYDYYGMVMPKNKFDRLVLSTDIIAVKPDHAIILNMLREYENAKLSVEVTDEQIQSFYLNNMYKYYQLDGKSIILPEIYFNLKR